jgi:hypothetical protein
LSPAQRSGITKPHALEAKPDPDRHRHRTRARRELDVRLDVEEAEQVVQIEALLEQQSS